MQRYNQSLSLPAFFQSLQGTPAVLMLDYDGTLAPFQIDPKQAVPYPGIIDLLSRIMRETKTQLHIVSGRGLYDLLPHIKLDPLPDIWGSHGAEHLSPQGGYHKFELTSDQTTGLKQGWSEANALFKRIEQKPVSVAVHWRGMESEEAEKLKKLLILRWTPMTSSGLEIHHFDGGIELRVLGMNKGTVVQRIVQHAKNLPMAFCGDDATDEEAFAILGAQGLKVLVRRDERPTAADIRLSPPEELFAFLEEWLKSNRS